MKYATFEGRQFCQILEDGSSLYFRDQNAKVGIIKDLHYRTHSFMKATVTIKGKPVFSQEHFHSFSEVMTKVSYTGLENFRATNDLELEEAVFTTMFALGGYNSYDPRKTSMMKIVRDDDRYLRTFEFTFEPDSDEFYAFISRYNLVQLHSKNETGFKIYQGREITHEASSVYHNRIPMSGSLFGVTSSVFGITGLSPQIFLYELAKSHKEFKDKEDLLNKMNAFLEELRNGDIYDIPNGLTFKFTSGFDSEGEVYEVLTCNNKRDVATLLYI